MCIIAGTARGRKIEAPEGIHTRPTLDRVRENLFNILQMKTRGSRVLDLFAGSGALSLEAIVITTVLLALLYVSRRRGRKISPILLIVLAAVLGILLY